MNDVRKAAISPRRWPVRIRSLTIFLYKDGSSLVSSQDAAHIFRSSSSVSTRERPGDAWVAKLAVGFLSTYLRLMHQLKKMRALMSTWSLVLFDFTFLRARTTSSGVVSAT